MAQRMFHPPEVWLTKDAITFTTKHLTLIPEQRKELESDLVQESFLKDYEKTPGYKASFEFKTKMFPFMRSQRTSLVPLFQLTFISDSCLFVTLIDTMVYRCSNPLNFIRNILLHKQKLMWMERLIIREMKIGNRYQKMM